MKIILISCFGLLYEDNKKKSLEYFFNEQGYKFEYITSDFDHHSKKRYRYAQENTVQIKTLPYKKNISLSRLISHYMFSKKVVSQIKKSAPDLIYAIVPPNSLVRFLSNYKKKYNVKLIYDIYDLWPETLPIKKTNPVLKFIFRFWSNLRDKGLRYADHIITECNLYQDVLKDSLRDIKTKTIYPIILSERIDGKFVFDGEKIHLCYLGSINNIIDIPRIADIIRAINLIKPIVCHIIGDGESKDELIYQIKEAGAYVEYYGRIYDYAEKQKIFDKCYFGLNIMKDSVCVGMTLKSIDYFHAGLPILNNIKADTAGLVESNGIGFNITDSDIDNVAAKIADMNENELRQMRANTQEIFGSRFALPIFYENMKEVLNSI